MGETEYSLNELASLAGQVPRTVRSYIEQGLLPGPVGLGRAAKYTRHHLLRLQAIQHFKNVEKLSFTEIRARLLTLSPEDLEQLSPAVTYHLVREEPRASASDYLASMAPMSRVYEEPPRQRREPPKRSESPVESLATAIEQSLGGRSAPPKARGETWVRIPITRDLDLVRRGTADPKEIRALERIADAVRQYLVSGGMTHGEQEE